MVDVGNKGLYHPGLQRNKSIPQYFFLRRPSLFNTDLVAAGALSLVLEEGPPVSQRRKRRHPEARQPAGRTHFAGATQSGT